MSSEVQMRHHALSNTRLFDSLKVWELIVIERDDERQLETAINTTLIDVNNIVLYHYHHRHLCQTCELIDSTDFPASPMRAQIYLHSFIFTLVLEGKLEIRCSASLSRIR